MKLRSGRIIGMSSDLCLLSNSEQGASCFISACPHSCLLWNSGHDGCCLCQDKRPIKVYRAYNNSNVFDYSDVERSYYYCPNCKNKDAFNNYHSNSSKR